MSKRSAAAWSAARSVGSFVQHITRQLESARRLQQVVAAVKAIHNTFVEHHSNQESFTAADEELQEINSNLQQHAQAVGWPVLQQCFYQDQFSAWSTCVLTVAGGEWLPKDQDGTLRQLIRDTFLHSPAAATLEALIAHLSSVLPTLPNRHSSTVTAVAADLAAELLAERFAAASSTGIQQLLQHADPLWHQHQQQQLVVQHPEQQRRSEQQQEAAGGEADSHPCDDQQLEEVAALLAAVPDRVQQLLDVPAALQPDQFVHHVLQQAVQYTAQHVETSSSSSSSSSSCASRRSAVSAGSGPVAFTALLLRKFMTRGHARPAAAAVLQLLASAEAAATQNGIAEDAAAAEKECASFTRQQQQQYVVALQAILLHLCPHKSSAEKLLLQLLRLATAQQPTAQTQQQQQLMTLLCPLLICSHNLRTVATRKLLTGRTLPLPSLSLLLLLLQRCQPPLLPEAAVALAQSWSDKAIIMHSPVQQQAYMTAALVQCIQQLPKDLIDPLTAPIPQQQQQQPAAAASNANAGTASATNYYAAVVDLLRIWSKSAAAEIYEGLEPPQLTLLLPAILQGVSSRLASPSAAIRSQAMRVGRAFSMKLDPDKPLFTDAGDLSLMPEEIWPGAVPKIQIRYHDQDQNLHDDQDLQQQQQQQREVDEKNRNTEVAGTAARNTSTGSSSSKFAALNRLQEALASPEPDSDDDDDDQIMIKPAAAAAASAFGDSITDQDSPSLPSNNNLTPNSKITNRSTEIKDNCEQDHDDDLDLDNDDDLISDDGSVSSLIAFDLTEDLSAESWWGPDGLGVPDCNQSLSLRGLAAAVRKQDDADAVLDALARVEVLVRAEPDELPVVAPELARSLLHCKIPVWATTESNSSSSSRDARTPNPAAAIGLDSNAEVQRQRALTAVLSLSPLTVGDTVISELYSPHLDQYQRMLILDCLAAAAVEMSDYRKAPRVTAAAPGQVPKLLPSLAEQKRLAAAATRTAALEGSSSTSSSNTQLTSANGATDAAAAASSNSRPSAAAAAPGMSAVSSRVWGKVALQKQKAAAAAGASSSAARTFRNRFAPIAIRWASLLLENCDVKHHGIDLFGRDSLLLGRLLTVFGTFVEAAAATPAAVPLVAGLLELLKANEVSGHKEVFVRRSALVAASQIVRHLPPARLAGAMVGRQQDLQDQVLVERLQWLMSWSQAVAATDVDEQCRMLAAGCCAWHVELAEGAMACLEQMPESEGPSLVGTKSVSGRSQKEGVKVTLPSLTDRLVLQG